MATVGVRTVVASVLLYYGSGAVPTLSDTLVVERRDAHVRALTQCGRKKACLMKPAAGRGAPAAALPATDLSHDATVPLRRWSEDQFDSVTVWIGPGDSLPLWHDANRTMVRDAFHKWSSVGAPVHFIFVSDPRRADVRVVWSDSLSEGRAGQVTRFTDSRGWVVSAVMEMSTRNITGAAQDSLTVRAVALHEVGHLLGLEHSANERDIMAPWVVVRRLSRNDRAAMRTLYGMGSPANPRRVSLAN